MNTRTHRFGGTRARLLALASLAPISSLHAAAANGTWNFNGSGNWSDTTKWTSGLVASGASSTADFSLQDITANQTVTVDAPFTIGTLRARDNTTSSNEWIFSGAPLTLDNGDNAPVFDILNLSTTAARGATVSAPLVGSKGLRKTGNGLLTLSGTNGGLTGTLTLDNVTGTNLAGVVLTNNNAIGGMKAIDINGTATTGPYLSLSGGVTLDSDVTINLNSPGGNVGPRGAIRSEGANTVVNTINGPINVLLNGARISNNSARRLDIKGAITGGAVNVIFRDGANEGIHLTNTGNNWTGPTTHSGGSLWFDPGTMPAANLQIAASDPGTIQTSGTFNRALGLNSGEAYFTLSAGRAMGFGARGGPLTVNFGGAGAEVSFDTATNPDAPASAIRTNTLVLNGNTADNKLTLVNPLNLNNAPRTLHVDANVAEVSNGLRGDVTTAANVTKTGTGTLLLSNASTWRGNLILGSAAGSANNGYVRISHPEALGAPDAVKNIDAMGLDRGVSMLELTGGISVDANKTLRMWGKNLAMTNGAGSGQMVSLRNVSGNNTWNGNVLISISGGAYGVESLADTFTIGGSPATSSVLRNDVANSTRPFFFFGPGNFVVNSKVTDNGNSNTGVNNSGIGTLSITRADNDFDTVPNLFAGTTEIASLGASGQVSSLGTANAFNLGGALRYLGAGDTSDRTFSMLPTGATLDSSGTGPLVLSAPTLTHHAGIPSSIVVPFAAGATSLVVNDTAGIAVGQTITGTGLAANTTVTAVDVTTRTITISAATTAAAVNGNGVAVTFGNANTINRTLTFTGSNTGNNKLAAPLTNPGPGVLSVVKNGAGTWMLNGVGQNYTGSTAINQGTLGFDGGLPNLNTLTVAPAATLALGNVKLVVNPETGRALDIDGSLLLTGPVDITLPQAAPSGTQTIIDFASGSGAVNFTSNYRGTTFAMNGNSATATTNPAAALPLIWTGLVDDRWDTKVTGNWKNSGFQQSFFWGDPVRFDDTVIGSSTVKMVGELRPASVTIDSNEDVYTLDDSEGGFLSGPLPLTKAGTTTAMLGGVNTFSGGITINKGVLKPVKPQSLGAPGNDVTVNVGGQLDINGTMNTNRDYDFTIAGTGVDGTGAVVNTGAGFTNGVRSLTLSGDATIGGSGRWDVRPTVAGQGTIDLNGFALTKTGINFMGFVDSVLEDGVINVNEGTLALTRLIDSTVGEVNVNNGASLWLENYTAGNFGRKVNVNDSIVRFQSTTGFPIASAVTLTGTATFETIDANRNYTIQGDVSGSGSFVKSNDANLILAGTNNYFGTTTINAGTLTIGNQNAISTLGGGAVINNGNLAINRSDNAYVVTNPISGTGRLTIGQLPAGNLDALVTVTGANSFAGDVTVLSGGLKIFNASALGTGTKKIILNGTNGRAQFNLDGSGGNITVPAEMSLETSNGDIAHPSIANLAGDNTVQGSITMTVGAGATSAAVFGGTLSLNGPITANTTNRRLILGGTAGSGAVNGAISNSPTNQAVGLDKVDPITWTLTGANSYTGTTAVSAGTLLVNGNQGTATGAITVSSGATLGGIGTIGGNTTALAGSTIAPGNNNIDTLTTNSGISIAGTLAIEVNAIFSDRLSVAGTLDVTGSTLAITTLAAPAQESYVIASYSGLTGTFSSVTGLPAGYTLNYNYNGEGLIALVKGGSSPYGSFETANGIAGAGSNTDSDNDGIPNGIEFVIGGDPSGPGSDSSALLPVATLTPTHVNFVFRRTDESASANPYVQYGSALTGWTTAQNNVNGVTITTENDGFGTGVDRVTVAIPRTLATDSKLFARLRVDIP